MPIRASPPKARRSTSIPRSAPARCSTSCTRGPGASPKLHCADTPPADGSGNVTIRHRTLAALDALHVKFTFCASNGDDGGALQCLIAVTDTVPRLEPTRLTSPTCLATLIGLRTKKTKS